MDVLADLKASSRVDGVVLFNSAVMQPNYRFSIGYVVQVSLKFRHHDMWSHGYTYCRYLFSAIFLLFKVQYRELTVEFS